MPTAQSKRDPQFFFTHFVRPIFSFFRSQDESARLSRLGEKGGPQWIRARETLTQAIVAQRAGPIKKLVNRYGGEIAQLECDFFDLQGRREPALHLCMRHGFSAGIRILFPHADFRFLSPRNETLLSIAAKNGYADLALRALADSDLSLPMHRSIGDEHGVMGNFYAAPVRRNAGLECGRDCLPSFERFEAMLEFVRALAAHEPTERTDLLLLDAVRVVNAVFYARDPLPTYVYGDRVLHEPTLGEIERKGVLDAIIQCAASVETLPLFLSEESEGKYGPILNSCFRDRLFAAWEKKALARATANCSESAPPAQTTAAETATAKTATKLSPRRI